MAADARAKTAAGVILFALLVGDERYRLKVRDIEAMLDRCTGLRVVTDPI